MRLMEVEVLIAAGERPAAERALATAGERLRERALRIDDARLRRTFLERIAEHARTRARCRELLGQDPLAELVS